MPETAPVRIEATAAGAPAVIREGLLEYHKDTDLLYVSDGTNKNEIALAGSTSGGRLPHWDNEPANPHAYSDEFNTTSLDAKWTIKSAGTTNPATTGTINLFSSLTTPIVDCATIPGCVMLQSDNSSVKAFGIEQSVTQDTNCTWFVKMLTGNRFVGAFDRGDQRIYVSSSTIGGALTHYVSCGTQKPSGSGYYRGILEIANPGYTGPTTQDYTPVSVMYVAIWKVGNVYHYGLSLGDSQIMTHLGTLTKTTVTSLPFMSLMMYTASETPSHIVGFDFVRYYPSTVFDFRNP